MLPLSLFPVKKITLPKQKTSLTALKLCGASQTQGTKEIVTLPDFQIVLYISQCYK